MVKAIQIILIAWFVIVNVFIFVPSYKILKGIDNNDAMVLPQAPELTSPPNLSVDPNMNPQSQQEIIKANVSFYTQQVIGHNQKIDAYKKQLDSLSKTRQMVVYELVIKQTIMALITGLTAALVGFAFAKTAEMARIHFDSRARERESLASGRRN